jgi:hypothetical protein
MGGQMMRRLIVVLTLGVASCQTTSSPSPTPTTIASGSDPVQKAEALQNAGVVNSNPQDAGLAPVAIDQSKHFVFADVYVSLGDPTGQRQLAPYLLKPEVWTIDKFENVSDTQRHYRFRRIAGPDGKALPDVDPFAPPKQ